MTATDSSASAPPAGCPVAHHAPDPVVDPATRAFSRSIAVSAVRCGLTYVVFPWLLPLLGIAGGVGPAIGIAVGVIAIAFNVLSIRRFWGSRHRWRWPITVLNTTVIVLLLVLIGLDIADL